MSLHRPADRGRRRAGDRPDPDHPDRRHRPVGRCDLHPVDDGHGQPRRQQRRPGVAGAADRHRARHRWPGCINGLLVTRLNLPPFIVTLGTLSIFTAIALLYSGGASIQDDRHARHPELDRATLSRSGRSGSRSGSLVVVLLRRRLAFVLSQTAWGRHVYAVGDDIGGGPAGRASGSTGCCSASTPWPA